MSRLKGTRTEKNLLTSFAGESQARNRYTYFAGAARKEGFVQIADIFEETADQEKEHAKRFFKFLEGGEVEIRRSFPAGVIGGTLENLRAAAAGEHYEHSEMYPGFAAVAREEGFEAIADAWESDLAWRRSSTRSATESSRTTSRPAACSQGPSPWSGAAATAATFTRGPMRRTPARPASIPRHTSSFWGRIGDAAGVGRKEAVTGTGAPASPAREQARTVRWAIASVSVAVLGILVSAAGQRFGLPAFERLVGPGLTVAGAVVWVGFRLRRGRAGRR